MKRFAILAAVFAAAIAGCDDPARPAYHMPRRDVSIRPAEVPAMDLALALRVKNWTSTGSCVWASTASQCEWLGMHEWAQWIRAYKAGGAIVEDVAAMFDRGNVDYVYTTSGDLSLLEKATQTRRGAIIYFYKNHCINFVGHHQTADGDWAFLLDNNRVGAFIKVPWAEFVPKWMSFGGTAMVILGTPPPPEPNL